MVEPTDQMSYDYNKRPLWQWILIYVIIGAVVYGLIYYFVIAKKGGYNYNQGSSQYQQQPAVSSETNTQASGETQVTVEGSEFSFTPSTVTVKKGESVQLTFKNTGSFPHNFVIADLNVQTKTIQSGQEDTVTFTPEKTGQFSFVCSVPGHTDKGMTGTLVVQ